MADDFRIALYGQGLFGQDNPQVNRRQLDALRNSGFNTMILFALHVFPNGDFYYGDTPIVQNGVFSSRFSYLPALVRGLRTGGTIDRILLSIGSADASDWAHLRALLGSANGTRTLQNNFTALVGALPLDGFDFDLEEFPLSSYTDAVVTLALLLNRQFGSIITFAPYTDEQAWLGFLAGVYARNNRRQIVSGFNLQCYSGGTGNDPAEWARAIANYGSPLGIDDPDAFIVPGFSADDGPSVICDEFNGLHVGGGFLWNAATIFRTSLPPSAYAQAIVNGLNGQCGSTSRSTAAAT